MFRVLLKKQLLESGARMMQNKRLNKRSPKSRILLYVILFVFVAAMFFPMVNQFSGPLLDAGAGWLYFALLGLLSMLLGVFGSVFSTFSILYQAKDNELLLSLPIPPRLILTVRLVVVGLWGLLFEALIFVPALISYWRAAAQRDMLQPGAVPLSLLLMLLIAVFILSLSCILGWVVAKISGHIRNKSFVTVLLSLVLFGGYYYLYSQAYRFLMKIVDNVATISASLRGAAAPLYWLGRAGEGSLPHLLLFALLIAAIFAVVYLVLARSFLKMATTNRGAARRVYREKPARQLSPARALLGKECRRFLGSATYMINCGLATLLLPLLGVFALLGSGFLRPHLAAMPVLSDFIAVIAVALICLLASMNDITAPSVSLEGKNLWLLQSLPVTAWAALKAKLKLHLLLTWPPTLVCAVCLIIALRPAPLAAVMIVALPLVFVLFSAIFGLTVNLRRPNLQWSTEIVPVKQSMGVAIALFGGWLLTLAVAGLYVLLHFFLPEALCFALCLAALATPVVLLLLWLKKKGARIFAEL